MGHVDYSCLPESLRDGAQCYIERGIVPGAFLTAVICNDLYQACVQADPINRRRLHDIVFWFYNNAPDDSWGSAEKMVAWIARSRALQSASLLDWLARVRKIYPHVPTLDGAGAETERRQVSESLRYSARPPLQVP
jgi:hypothetical protein